MIHLRIESKVGRRSSQLRGEVVLGQQQASLRAGAVLFALLMLFADISGGVLATTTPTSEVSEYEPPILVEGLPPLMCGEEL